MSNQSCNSNTEPASPSIDSDEQRRRRRRHRLEFEPESSERDMDVTHHDSISNLILDDEDGEEEYDVVVDSIDEVSTSYRRSSSNLSDDTNEAEDEDADETEVTNAVLNNNAQQPMYSTADELMLLLRQIRNNEPHPRHIDLQRKRLPEAYLNAFFSVLTTRSLLQSADVAVNNTNAVTRLRLSKSGITDVVMVAVAEFVRSNTTVVDLDLSRNEISQYGCRLLADAIKASSANSSNKVLRRLVLDSNPIGDEGAQVLCAALPGSGIQTLKLAKISMSVDQGHGVHALSTLLQDDDCPLLKLDVRSCGLGSAGASMLALALYRQSEKLAALATRTDDAAVVEAPVTGLQALHLGRNNIGDDGVQELAAVLQCPHTTLTTLDLQSNPFTNVGAECLVQSLQWSNHTFTKLKLKHCNDVSESVKERLLDLLLMNGHGPDLARRTKLAIQHLQLCHIPEAPLGGRYSSNQDYFDASCYTEFMSEGVGLGATCAASASSTDEDGGADGIVREVVLSHKSTTPSTSTHGTSLEDCPTCPFPPIPYKDAMEATVAATATATSTDTSFPFLSRRDTASSIATCAVAAAAAHVVADDKDDDDDLDEACVICFDESSRQCILLPCQHYNCCPTCASKLSRCHMCRETIVKVFRLPPSRPEASLCWPNGSSRHHARTVEQQQQVANVTNRLHHHHRRNPSSESVEVTHVRNRLSR